MKPLSDSEQAHLDAYRWSVRTFPNTAQFLIIKRGPWWLFDTTEQNPSSHRSWHEAFAEATRRLNEREEVGCE